MTRTCKTGVSCVAFGAGLLAATILPMKCVLVLLAFALISVGCSCAKKH